MKIYIEGGGPHDDDHKICRKGFRLLLESAGFTKNRPRLVACGSRNETYDHFRAALNQDPQGNYAMLIDSEEPVEDFERPWDHLNARDGWERPEGCTDEQVLFMATCMETWIVSDRGTLSKYYGKNFQASALPPPDDLERRDRHIVQKSLKHATRDCTNPYRKGSHSFDVLSKLQPEVLHGQFEAFRRVIRILNAKLD